MIQIRADEKQQWPSWHIAASTTTFPDPEQDAKLAQVFQTLDEGIKEFNSTPEVAIRLLGTGELGCHYTEEDAREWLKDAEFAKTSRGVNPAVMQGVAKVLQGAGVVDQGIRITDGDGVIGVTQ